VAEIAAKADFSWHPERNARASYQRVGAKPVWVQMGADPDVYHPVKNVTRQPGACFVGQRYADRDRWLAALLRAGVPVDIYGSGWGAPMAPNGATALPQDEIYLGRKQYHPGSFASYAQSLRETIARHGVFAGMDRLAKQWRYRFDTRALLPLVRENAKGWVDDIARAFAAYELCLNFSNVWADGRPGSALIPHVRLRDFEAPMCRTCYLTGHTDEIGEFYEIGKEIDTYRSVEELVDKTRFYLSNPGQAERLRNAGHSRAVRDHTWVRRFDELFRKIGVDSVKPKTVAAASSPA
jgi:spore maturation protein CgeB